MYFRRQMMAFSMVNSVQGRFHWRGMWNSLIGSGEGHRDGDELTKHLPEVGPLFILPGQRLS